MSRKVWQAVETETGKIRIVKTKERENRKRKNRKGKNQKRREQ